MQVAVGSQSDAESRENTLEECLTLEYGIYYLGQELD